MANVRIYFVITLTNLVFGRSLWIEAIVKPLAQQSPGDDIIVISPVMEVVALLTITFSVGTSIIQIRAALLTQTTRSHAALVWALVLTGAVVIVAVGSLTAARRGSSHENYTPT